MYRNYSKRFEEILSLKIPQWVVNLFVNIETADLQIQEELIERSINELLKTIYKDSEHLTEISLQSTISRFYPGL